MTFFTAKPTSTLTKLIIISAFSLFFLDGKAEGSLEKGNQLLEAQQYAEAIEEYNEAIKINPENKNVRNYRIILLESLSAK